LKRFALRNSCLLILLLFFLNACTGVVVKESAPGGSAAYQTRADQLDAVSEWGLVGKISLDDGDQGGSGRLQWDIKGNASEMDFHGALGRGAWNLQIEPGMVMLREANGAESSSHDVNTLVQDRIGWSIPVAALQWWVRGLAAPGTTEKEELDARGLLKSLDQFGWRIDFNRYKLIGETELPVRLDAVRGDYRVKLAISRWRMDIGDGAGS
jgi:outer membrane lipoprotein LolB